MDVENKGKKRWAIFFCVITVAILILSIVIIVVINLPKDVKQRDPASGPYDIYEDISYEINKKFSENKNMSGEQVLELYKSYIDKEDNPEVKAYLSIDYYLEMQVQDTSKSKNKEVLDGLAEADEVLNTASSAMIVWTTAEYYRDEKVAAKYKEIAELRMNDQVELEYTE